MVDALMMMRRRYTGVQGPMCEARCGLRMQRMRPVFSNLHYICVSASLTPMEQYGVDPGYYKGCEG